MRVHEFIELLLRVLILFVFAIGFINYSDELVRIFKYIIDYGWGDRELSSFVFIRLIPLFLLVLYSIVFWKISPWISKKILIIHDDKSLEVNLSKIFVVDNLIFILGLFMIIKSSFIFWRGVIIVYFNSSSIDIGERDIYLYIYGGIATFYFFIGLFLIKKHKLISKIFSD